ncbi:MbtH family protein [Paracoccus aminophilus]|uniref:MbtH domain-containing protein n=1 Tax=Paracoccus aminophilus JCM 7686 TaxID=1367847 RepID=S5Y4S8_PARAH|nr:MbtH family NRPS accessory protein [Paracoccus aminophilus]AGT10745.1 MbtH domain-containing protein [Paracoccus aminophilus JCM 7686]
MTRSFTSRTDWRILRNAEGRYSVWPSQYPLPAGWEDEGTRASRPDCLARIEELWQDPRPLALRQAMGGVQ